MIWGGGVMAVIENKKWTVLYYANGNNEYEPEMYKSFLELKNMPKTDKIDIIVELGRINRNVPKIIRPSESFNEDDEIWTGVRRYYIQNGITMLVEDMGNINMAHPANLYGFIKWGTEKYPAERYMLILGGHGAAFVGTLTDYSQDKPYIMGTVEMCKAINMLYKETGKQIDILLLDICYMNLVEIIYELGKEKENTSKSLITYLGEGPLSGLNYSNIVHILEKRIDEKSSEPIITEIINSTDFDMVGVSIDNKKLKRIKKEVDNLSYNYLTSSNEKNFTPFEILTDLNSDYPWHDTLIQFQRSLLSIVLYCKMSKNKNILNIIYSDIKDLINIYYKLSFAKGNYWTYILCGKKIDETLNFNVKESFQPTIILKNGLKSLIKVMNPTSSPQTTDQIYNDLVSYTHWKINNIKSKG